MMDGFNKKGIPRLFILLQLAFGYTVHIPKNQTQIQILS